MSEIRWALSTVGRRETTGYGNEGDDKGGKGWDALPAALRSPRSQRDHVIP